MEPTNSSYGQDKSSQGCRTRRPLTPAEQQIVLDNLGLVNKEANHKANIIVASLPYHPQRFLYRYQILDELCEGGWIGLCLAAQRFDPARGFKFSTYAYHSIRGAIQEAEKDCELRSGQRRGWHRWRPHRIVFFEEAAQQNKAISDHDFVVLSPERDDNRSELSPELVVLLNLVLDPREVQIVIAVHVEERHFDDVGKDYGISGERVRQIAIKARNKLRKSLGFMRALKAQIARTRFSERELRKSGAATKIA